MAPIYLFLRPGDLPDLADFCYVSVGARARSDGSHVQGQRLSDAGPPAPISIPSPLLNTHKVDASEASARIGAWLCIPVAFIHSQQWFYGVVSGYQWDPRTKSGSLSVLPGDPEEAEPITVPFPGDTQLHVIPHAAYATNICHGVPTHTMTRDALDQVHLNLESKFQGRPRQRGNRILSTLVRGLFISPHPRSGEDPVRLVNHVLEPIVVRAQHVLDWFFFAARPSSARSAAGFTAGSLFTDPNLPTPAPPIGTPTATEAGPAPAPTNLSELHDRQTALEASQALALETFRQANQREIADIKSQLTAIFNLLHNRSDDTLPPPAVADSPSLPLAAETPAEHPRLTRASRPSSTTFTPSPTQSHIYGRMLNDRHSGRATEPHALLEYFQSSACVKFFPFPAILNRAYDFGFGDRGLSILHFTRVSPMQRLHLRASVKINMTDFSLGAALPKPANPTTMSDISDCLLCLRSFAEEFWSKPTVHIIEAAHDLCHSDAMAIPLDHEFLSSFARWIDYRLQEWRTAAQFEPEESLPIVAQAIAHSLQPINEELRLLRETARDRVAIQRSKLNPGHQSKRKSGTSSTSSVTPGKRARLSPDLAKLVPKDSSDRMACLRFLSIKGCINADELSSCTSKKLAHFTPPTPLHPQLKAYIVQEYSGLREGLP